jgi:hypothetical protein
LVGIRGTSFGTTETDGADNGSTASALLNERKPKAHGREKLMKPRTIDVFEDMRQLLAFAMSTSQIICEQPVVKCRRLLKNALLLAL